MKIYSLEELKEKNIDGYLNAIRWLRKNVGNSSSDEALEMWARQAEYYADKDGNLYKRCN